MSAPSSPSSAQLAIPAMSDTQQFPPLSHPDTSSSAAVSTANANNANVAKKKKWRAPATPQFQRGGVVELEHSMSTLAISPPQQQKLQEEKENDKENEHEYENHVEPQSHKDKEKDKKKWRVPSTPQFANNNNNDVSYAQTPMQHHVSSSSPLSSPSPPNCYTSYAPITSPTPTPHMTLSLSPPQASASASSSSSPSPSRLQQHTTPLASSSILMSPPLSNISPIMPVPLTPTSSPSLINAPIVNQLISPPAQQTANDGDDAVTETSAELQSSATPPFQPLDGSHIDFGAMPSPSSSHNNNNNNNNEDFPIMNDSSDALLSPLQSHIDATIHSQFTTASNEADKENAAPSSSNVSVHFSSALPPALLSPPSSLSPGEYLASRSSFIGTLSHSKYRPTFNMHFISPPQQAHAILSPYSTSSSSYSTHNNSLIMSHSTAASPNNNINTSLNSINMSARRKTNGYLEEFMENDVMVYLSSSLRYLHRFVTFTVVPTISSSSFSSLLSHISSYLSQQLSSKQLVSHTIKHDALHANITVFCTLDSIAANIEWIHEWKQAVVHMKSLIKHMEFAEIRSLNRHLMLKKQTPNNNSHINISSHA